MYRFAGAKVVYIYEGREKSKSRISRSRKKALDIILQLYFSSSIGQLDLTIDPWK